MSDKILVIDDEPGIRSLCSEVLRRVGYDVEVADSGEAGLATAREKHFDLVLSDINLPGIDGLQVVEHLMGKPNPPTLLLITAYPSVATAVKGMKLGARDYLSKPFTADELRMATQRALDEDRLRSQNKHLRKELGYGKLLGRSPAMQELRETIAKVAKADSMVLVSGESGTGKELVARAIHYEGHRAGGNFVAVNCGALVGSLLESELFGHVRGAFTGAESDKQGLFVVADKGTLFLDEVGELPLDLQPKLLRALQDGEIKAVGATASHKVHARVIAATNRDLQVLVEEKSFREDLYYRLNVITIRVPPLRERAQDIPDLALHFAARAAEKARRTHVAIHPDATDWLVKQPWRGNVRELENAVERAVVLASTDELGVEDFEIRATPAPRMGGTENDELVSLDDLERRHILRVLDAVEGQKTKASAILGINRTTLWKKLRQYGVE
jgi:DNA-binding NtrC family response regulator